MNARDFCVLLFVDVLLLRVLAATTLCATMMRKARAQGWLAGLLSWRRRRPLNCTSRRCNTLTHTTKYTHTNAHSDKNYTRFFLNEAPSLTKCLRARVKCGAFVSVSYLFCPKPVFHKPAQQQRQQRRSRRSCDRRSVVVVLCSLCVCLVRWARHRGCVVCTRARPGCWCSDNRTYSHTYTLTT